MIDSIYIAKLAIKNYLGIDENYWNLNNLDSKYSIVIELVKENYDKYKSVTNGLVGINSISQGSQNISFNSNISNILITEEIKLLLPRPKSFYVW
ncbi:hypothetical protein [Clostridium tertium]|uniref:Uncharacterized protein n=1 Tax=Clostridium tertium TaxID=1559 RepID=A0A9X3XME1_9CLOT|nr:hypothetical protein [Clostridium tertium]MBU6135218.1 hypothetical protein [Clostridium tertium]MDC4241818.1 hypothetical protein [Clostridium tertium]